jgi:serine/threonine-protein kinase
MHKVMQSDPPPPSTLNAALPPGFDAVIARALAKKPAERFQTAREFQAAMLQALQGKMPSSTSSAMATQRPSPEATARRAAVLAIDPAVVAEVERSLSRHVGPLAKVLVKRTQAEAQSIGQFFRTLAENIPDADEHKAFMKKMDAVKASLPSQAAAAPAESTAILKPAAVFTPEVLAAAEKRLASYVGPLARVFIKEAAGKSGNIKELYRQLAAHIDEEDERRAFLASLPS